MSEPTTGTKVALKDASGNYLDPWIKRDSTIDSTTASSTNPPTTAAVKSYVDAQSGSSGGIPVGTIYAYPSSNAPEGAFLLNGQTISSCQTSYPLFWSWLTAQSTAGTIRTVTNAVFESELTSTGNCGAFVLDTTAGSVRLPSITTGFIQGADSTNIGNSVAAGLPNITGGFTSVNNYGTGAITAGASGYQIAVGTATSYTYAYAKTLDASNSSSIYGSSTTVQPPAVRFCWCIQVFHASAASHDITSQEAATLTSQIQTRMQTDFANATSNLDVVVDSNSGTDTYGPWWWRKYKSGWIEQGGVLSKPSSNTIITLGFQIAFADTNYTILKTCGGSDTSNYTSPARVSFWEKTTTGATTQLTKDGDSNWYACGMSNTSVTE